MKENRLRTKWELGEAGARMLAHDAEQLVGGNLLSHAGFDWLCVDLQHGLID